MDEALPKAARTAPPACLAGGRGGSGQQDRVHDRISELPDDILGAILFLLPLKEAGRTTTLSKRWRGMFAYSPIALDDERVARRRLGRRPSEVILHFERVAVITRILAAHTGPIPRVRLAKTRFRGDGDWDGLATDAFAARCVKELIVHSPRSVQFFPAPPLRSLQLVHCDWFSHEPPPASFAHLRELSLRAVKISERDLHALMDQCIALESLMLSSYHKYCGAPEQVEIAKFHVRSQSLRSLSLELCELEEVVIVDAPNLERLLGEPKHYRRDCKVTLVNAPKMQILGLLSRQFHLVHYGNIFKGMHLALSGPIPSVRMLALCLNLCDLYQMKQILQFLNYFPSLETLHIKLCSQLPKDLRHPKVPYASYLELAGSVACLRGSVKTIVLSPFSGCDPELQFAKILLGSAKVLKSMRILCTTTQKTWIGTTRRRLGLESNASLNARVAFHRNSPFRDTIRDVVLDASSLAIPDPFFVRMTNIPV